MRTKNAEEMKPGDQLIVRSSVKLWQDRNDLFVIAQRFLTVPAGAHLLIVSMMPQSIDTIVHALASTGQFGHTSSAYLKQMCVSVNT